MRWLLAIGTAAWPTAAAGALLAAVMATAAAFVRGEAARSQRRGRGGERRSRDARASTIEGTGGARHASKELGPRLGHGGHALGHASAVEALARTGGVRPKGPVGAPIWA
jgi:hypothetical protein